MWHVRQHTLSFFLTIHFVDRCYLLTYFFITGILSLFENTSDSSEVNEKATTFVHRFGAYLKLHACLVAAASSRAESVIRVLLELAQHDPRHKDVAKHIARMGSLVLYEEVSKRIFSSVETSM